MCERQIELHVDSSIGRLDRFVANQIPELSRSAAQQLIRDGHVSVNGATAKASHALRPGDLVVVVVPADHRGSPPPSGVRAAASGRSSRGERSEGGPWDSAGEEPTRPRAEAIPLHVIYEDDTLIVLDKPAGLVVHPAPGHPDGTLVDALLARYPALARSADDAGTPHSNIARGPAEAVLRRPGIVHRLDRDTSGLMLVAKSEKVRHALQQQFQDRQVHKAYVALLYGHLEPARGRIEAPIGRDPHHRQRMAVRPGGREAVTEYCVLEVLYQQTGPGGGAYTLVEARPETGRTHQIRVHLASIGHPVVGDRVYGRRKGRLPVPRQFLHASRLEFLHPVTGQYLQFEAPLPPDLAAVLALLGAAATGPLRLRTGEACLCGERSEGNPRGG